MSFFRHAAKPELAVLVGAVFMGLGGASFMLYRSLATDPTIQLYNKRENPYPWLKVAQDQNIKMYAVNNKFESKEGIRTTFVENRK
ncbi:hypothetical protein BASA50_007106 [Batrachochytrium salamandrivorans]|uniref:NADH dehydrogenase [ubiquinone] 1 alpha subcomplex subunit 4 n=1 Tax=Batrachochytrium salamandrivorans TaxID=1357716 RepID=A0ABQ8F875_9FUNG|nr:hypothetical protein BASA62_002299 [Batrachochytrium salamandrivorans]KAH6575106.1 hypothetical protein BASA60_005177 [Batrachochytrium salamandrivorans]KAH6579098.1 hypothetical protein BASA61_010486 [Batrachochytrium salamandrivorans]KAH6593881.1 hypothetical protein BASA50_007106 [Batrachochytrium salamandrivorans]KAH9272279.1 hypothetical protein BASA83_005371 [Batrachochytrium salamandrivorans]